MISLSTVRRAALIVAHPDDETLWAGGLVLRTASQIYWTVVCCSIPRLDPIRVQKFQAACSALRVRKTIVIQQVETKPPQLLPYLDQELPLRLPQAVDMVVTHGIAGEYGHVHHCQLGEWIRRNVHLPVVSIALRPKPNPIEGMHVVALTEEEWRQKERALRCYNHVMPYEGRVMPKWQALLRRYGTTFDLQTEVYDGLRA